MGSFIFLIVAILLFIIQLFLFFYIWYKLSRLGTIAWDFDTEEGPNLINMIRKHYCRQNNFAFYLLWSTIILSVLIGGFMSIMIFIQNPNENTLIKCASLIFGELALTFGAWHLFRYTSRRLEELVRVVE